MPTPRTLPLLPLRDIVVFPHMVAKLFVGREKSISALDGAIGQEKEIFLATQKNAKANDPVVEDIHEVGTIGVVVQMLRLPDGTVQVLVEGRRRARIRVVQRSEPYFVVDVDDLEEPPQSSVEAEALMRTLQNAFRDYVKLNPKVEPDVALAVAAIEEPSHLADAVAGNLTTLKLSDRQTLLETAGVKARLERLLELLQAEIEILQVEKKIRSRVKKQMERTQKEYYLNEQIQAIQKELGGERDELRGEVQEIEEKLKQKQLSKEAADRVKKELKKLKMMHPTSAEATVVRHYIDWILGLPWGDEKTTDNGDLEEAARILDEDHHGLGKVKERILEYLAVQTLTQKIRGPVLCLVGPPGVGKTSLAKSIARCANRKFVRLSLGGVRDEAEIRGHRRTYIGALPGKLVQSMKKAGTTNPVFLLDEIDKLSSDFRGDPASALLEVLDPEQNASFVDHYLDLDYDLSNVLFVTTANTLSGIPYPLLDRMEVISLAGYTEMEKLHIAKKYLVPRQRQENGLAEGALTIEEPALRTLIHHYTKESGVRSLEREIASLCRKAARRVVTEGKDTVVEVTPHDLPKLLGPTKYRSNKVDERDELGVTNGLSVTSHGGELLVAEVAIVPGKGKLLTTGKLGDVMQESAQAALSYVRSRAHSLGLPPDFYTKIDIHVHFPEGAIPKDGPSAGITVATCLVSALTKNLVQRHVAMTGEITLRGRVLPIGGLKDKLMAAHRAGMKTVIAPKENRRDLREVPGVVMRAMRVVLVEHMDDVLREALVLEDPDAFLPPARSVTEYVEGKLVERKAPPVVVAPRDPARRSRPIPLSPRSPTSWPEKLPKVFAAKRSSARSSVRSSRTIATSTRCSRGWAICRARGPTSISRWPSATISARGAKPPTPWCARWARSTINTRRETGPKST